MSNVQLFNFKSNQIRVVEIEGNPWFVAADVCRQLYDMAGSNASHYTKHLDDSEKLTGKRIPGMRGAPPVLISESGLYKLVMRSDKPEARRFQQRNP